jgi:hypothetical protein
MSIERREIILTGNELPDAVRAHARGETDFLPIGIITDIAVHTDEEPVAVTIKLQGAAAAEPVRVLLDKDKCMDVLLRFCLERNIPLPRAGRKLVKVISIPTPAGAHRCVCLSIILKPDTAAFAGTVWRF